MSLLARLRDEHGPALERFLEDDALVAILLLSPDLSLVDCNQGFLRVFELRDKPLGRPLSEFLSSDGVPLPPFPDIGESKTLRLNLLPRSGAVHVASFQVYAGPGGYSLFGERLMLTNNDLLGRMSHLHDEVVNITRELHKRNSALERASAELKSLERLFLHDVLNTAGGILGLSELLLWGEEPEVAAGYARDIQRLAGEVVAEIQGHRQMSAAERGDLAVTWEEVFVSDLLDEVAGAYRHHAVARGRSLRLGAVVRRPLVTDRTILRRILGNLLKNAFEATTEGGTVTLEAVEAGQGAVAFSVHNRGVMSDEVQERLFQRSFSTKGGEGRGVGTHSVRLLTERYLGGEVSFRSREPEGTTFTVTLPGRAGDGR